MIVEFIGVPGSGKSTLAHSIAARFEDRGYPAELPRAYDPTAWARFLTLTRKLANLCCFVATEWGEFNNTLHILRILPQKDAISTFRMVQYYAYLSTIRKRCKNKDTVYIFDQGFAQLVYSLALFGNRMEDDALVKVLRMQPRPDVVIALHAPAETLFRRLDKRTRKGRLERQIRSRAQVIQDAMALVTKIEKILVKSGIAVLHYDEHQLSAIPRTTDDVFGMLWGVVTKDETLGKHDALGSPADRIRLADPTPRRLHSRL